MQISQAIKERSEAEEANKRLKVMREDEARFRKLLQQKRSEKLKVRTCLGRFWWFSPSY